MRNTLFFRKMILPVWGFLMLLLPSVLYPGLSYFKFENLNIQKGLSHNTVGSILKDRRGFMWFGTNDGLNRYDGHRIIVYRHDSTITGSISGNRFTALFQDSSDHLWVGTRQDGLNLYDRDNN
ncbi:MAG: histidine kinase, partial [bacterium]|nr:histidine kinase [bacterium]